MQIYQKRTDVPQGYTWHLESIFACTQDWEREFQTLQQSIPLLEELKGLVAQSGLALFTVLQKRDEISERLDRLYVYASLHKDEDTTNVVFQGMTDRALQLFVRTAAAVSSIEPEILALPQQTLERFMAETPALLLYKHQLNDLNRKRPHVRTAEIEAVLATVGGISEAPETIFSMLSNADLTFPPMTNEAGKEVKLTQANYSRYMSNPHRRVRKEAFEAMHSTLFKQRHTFAATLSAQIKVHLFYTKQRQYQTCREHALARSNIPVRVYDSLIEVLETSTAGASPDDLAGAGPLG